MRAPALGALALAASLAGVTLAATRDPEVWTAQQLEALRTGLIAEAQKSPSGTAGKQLRDEPNYRAAYNVSFRTGGAEEHDLWTDEIRVVSGEIDFVTGGTIEGRHPGGAEGEFRGTALTGATVTRRLRAGDIVEVPAGTPHWTKVVQTPVTTFVYKVR